MITPRAGLAGSFISDAEQSVEPQYKSFPPLDDTIVWIKNVDWQEVRNRCRGGLNNVGLIVAVIGEKTYDFGSWLARI